MLSRSPRRLVLLLAVGIGGGALSIPEARACDCPSCCCQNADAFSVSRNGPWHVADSPSFQVCSLASGAEAVRIARHCECLRTSLEATWHGADAPWSPRCQVVLHASVRGYRQAVGRGGESTVGSSLVTPARGEVRSRRIDLRTDVADVLTAALPHELCHLVIADRFRDGPPPLWFDEGLAIQYDPPANRELHERDFQRALSQGATFPLEELFGENGYPAREKWGAFYGQSGSLVRWLLARQSPEQLIRFVKTSRSRGAGHAVREIDDLGSVDALHVAWRRGAISLAASRPAALAIPTPDPRAMVSR